MWGETARQQLFYAGIALLLNEWIPHSVVDTDIDLYSEVMFKYNFCDFEAVIMIVKIILESKTGSFGLLTFSTVLNC